MQSILRVLALGFALLSLGGCVLALGNDSGEGYTDSSFSTAESSGGLARAVRARLDGDALTQGADLSVSSDGHGRVILGGVTSRPEVLARAVELALATPDVKSVRCRITIIR
jgi:hypothetical protein